MLILFLMDQENLAKPMLWNCVEVFFLKKMSLKVSLRGFLGEWWFWGVDFVFVSENLDDVFCKRFEMFAWLESAIQTGRLVCEGGLVQRL